MKFLILAALVAVAAADYHDDTFHFSTKAVTGALSGLQRSSRASSQYSGQYSSQYNDQAAYRQQYATARQVQVPAYTQYTQYSQAPVVVAQAPVVVAQPAVQSYYQPQQYSAATYSAGLNAPKYRILSQVQEADPAGPYKLSYSTENGIQMSEQGALVNGAEGPAVAAQGSYSYTGPDNQVYTVSYIADENGFRAVGDHLPTPPPIPAEILRSLEENARSGEQYDDQGRLLRN